MTKPNAQSPKPWMAPEIEKWEIEFDEQFSNKGHGSFVNIEYIKVEKNNIKDFIRQLLNKERQAVIEEIEKEMKDFLMDCLYAMEFEVINGNFAPYDDKSWPRWNEERKHQLDKLDAIIAKIKPQEFHRCKCGAISSWEGCFCERGGEKK